MKTENNSDLQTHTTDVEHIENLLKNRDDACAAFESAQAALGTSLLEKSKKLSSELGDIWFRERLFGPTESERKHLVRDLADRAQALVKRLTPSKWSNEGVRNDGHQVVYRLGGRS